MSAGFLERMKEFVVRLVKDTAFRAQLDNGTPDERQKVLQNAGYVFSKEEFETATINLIESKERGEFSDLTEEELAGVFGGLTHPIVQPMYGVIRYPVWPPIGPQPMYGVIVSTDL